MEWDGMNGIGWLDGLDRLDGWDGMVRMGWDGMD